MVTRETSTNVKFANEEMIFGCKQDGLIIVEANAQGIFELDLNGRRLQSEYPVVARNFKRMLVQDKVRYGEVALLEYAGYKFALIVNRSYVTCLDVDKMEEIALATKAAIAQLINKGFTKFYSGLFEAWNYGMFTHIQALLPKESEWIILKE